MIPQKQLTLADIFEDCKEIFESDKPHFLTLLENHIDLDEIVPISFRHHYYASTGRNRKYPLNAMLWTLIIQRLFSIPTDSLLLVFLHYSRHLREFCGFTKVPNSHPEILVEKKSKSPDEDKSLADSKALLPTLKDFKTKHPNINPNIFLGDTAFDTIEIYKALFEDFNFQKAFIPLKVKLSLDNVDYTFNENGIPCCPHDSTLPMKREDSKSHLKSFIA